MTYLALLAIGGFGFIAMFLLGFLHFGGGHHAHTHGHALARGGHAHHGHAAHADGWKGSNLLIGIRNWLSISPIDIFALLLGAGATGLLLRDHVGSDFLPWLAAAGGLVLDLLVVKTMMALMMRFVSHPSEGLEGMVAKSAEAVTGFDNLGRGLVRLCLDGQNVQLLATLEPDELSSGTTVRRGDEVMVVEVDSKRNTCRVTRDMLS